MTRLWTVVLTAGVLVAGALGAVAQPVPAALPPAAGPEEPRVVPMREGDGLYTQSWYVSSFLDLREDFAEAKAAGRRFAVVFEQRGCIYCTKMHTEVLARRYINDYVRENFNVVQIDLWGAREVTDFDGTVLTEKKLAERWGILFTPTVVFYKDDLSGLAGAWGLPLEVARMHLGMGPGTFYDMFVWIRHEVYAHDPSFQRFHLMRHNQRVAATKARTN